MNTLDYIKCSANFKMYKNNKKKFKTTVTWGKLLQYKSKG